MDKYEYKVRADEIRSLIQEKKYREAVEIADTIDWRNVRNSMMLCSISDLYKMCRRFEDSRDVLMLAYQRNPGGRMILYSLCELSIKLGDVVNAIEYYKEFVQVAPRDTGRFVLRYKLYTAQEVSLEERISVLEELQQYECKEKWMYELAYLYHMQGVSDKCVEECNQIVIYFGEGKYVIKALELKQMHEPLSAEQDILYRRLTGPKENDILVKDMDVSKFNTIDLQKELANSLAEVLFDDTKNLSDDSAKENVPEVSQEEPAEEVKEEVKEIVEEIEIEPVHVEDETIQIQVEEVRKEISEEKESPVEVVSQDTKVLDPISQDTRIFNAKEIEDAIKRDKVFYTEHKETLHISGNSPINESAKARTVLPKTGYDEMREVFPQTSSNSAIVFPSYDDMVSMEGDGQISFNIPEQEMVDKQITGQISIEEVLTEWERMKTANEKKWREDMRRKVIAQTTNLFKDFEETSRDGLLEKLEEEVSESKSIILTEEEEEKLNAADEEEVSISIQVEEVEESALSEEIPEEAAVEEVTEEPVTETEDKISEPAQDIREIIIEEEQEGPTPEELFFDRTPYIEIETEQKVESNDPEPEAEDNTISMPDSKDIDYLMAFAQAGEERDIVDSAVLETESETEGEETVEEISAIETEVTVDADESSVEDELTEESEAAKEEKEEVKETKEALEEVSDEETLNEDIEGAEKIEEDAPVNNEPVIRPSGFTEEQEERFEAFIQTEAGREQLKEVLSSISMENGHGNVIIGSEDLDSSVDLAKAIMMELSATEGISGKVAKIKASTLNAKDAEETLQKLYDGALIIQDANELRQETLESIRRVVTAPDKKLFVIMTATKRAKHRFIMDNSDLLESFNVSIDIEALTNKELVSYAKAYAYSKEYAIDEMGMLALHTRIDEKQTNDHSVNITEVKAIVDEAISRAKKKNVKHFVDVLVGKRYDSNDMVVLKEKDFAE